MSVVTGETVAGPIVRDACMRHLRDLAHAGARGWTYSIEKAERCYRFFTGVLKLNGGEFENVPFVLHPSQQFILGNLFGWVNAATGYRRFRVAYVEMGKGNGKSPLAAGIGHYGLVADNEPRAEIYAAATKKDQAMILFRDMVAMVDMSPSLKKSIVKSGKGDRVWNLFFEKSFSFARPISSDDGQSGPRPHIGLIDEIHEHKDNKVVEMVRAGTKGRRQALILMITNSGFNRHSVCFDYHEQARKVNEGSFENDAFFGYVCALDKNDKPFEDESCWVKANPLLGVSIHDQYLREQVVEARGMPSKESTVLRLNFCVWTESGNPLVPYQLWMNAKGDYDLSCFAGAQCMAGLDLSSVADLTCAMLSFVHEGCVWLWPLFYMPQGRLREMIDSDKVPYDVWAASGELTLVPGNAIDRMWVLQHIMDTVGRHGIDIGALRYDRWRIEDFKAAADREGFDAPMLPFGQGFKDMAPAVDEMERLLMQGLLRHPGNRVLTLHAANATVVSDPAGNRKLCKQTSTGRIDGMVAGVMSLPSADVELNDLSGYLANGPIVG